jgi:hypothetical protein
MPFADESPYFDGQSNTAQIRRSDMAAASKVQGPAAYFPSIEKTYGQPVAHWLKILDGLQDPKHMAQVAHLKTEHGLGHGHANALVAYHRAQTPRAAKPA